MSLSISTVIKLATSERVAADANQAGVDISGLTGKCVIVLNASVTEAADNTYDCKLQHSDVSGSGYVDAGVAFTQVTNSGPSFQTITMDVDGFKKYVRVVDDVGGTSPKCTRSVEIIGKAA